MPRKAKLKDPEAKKEAKKYANPIASRALILQQLEKQGKPQTRLQIAKLIGVQDSEQIEALRRRLIAMERDGQLVHLRRKGYVPASGLSTVTGRMICHRDGFGFLVVDALDDELDVFIPPRQMQGVFHGDRVEARVGPVDRRGRRSGSIIRVIERAVDALVGRYIDEDGMGVVIPINPGIQKQIMVKPGELKPQDGQYVRIKIRVQPERRKLPVGEVIEILGDAQRSGIEIELMLHAFGIPHTWPKAVLQEANQWGTSVNPEHWQGRSDLRELPFVTIDGQDAQDFDDAVCVKPLAGAKTPGWEVRVAIADVGFYVRLGTALDEEAQLRSTSVYMPGRVVPMLPEILSNTLCSLMPQVDRLAMVCVAQIDTQGNLLAARFEQAVIRSAARLTYKQVQRFMDGEAEPPKALKEPLRHLEAAFRALLKAREKRGAIGFETQETRIQFDKKGKIKNLVPVTRMQSHQLIEELMLLANRCSAEFLHQHQVPVLYRVHEAPAQEKLEALNLYLARFGLSIGNKGVPTGQDYQAFIEKIRDRDDFDALQMMLLRSLPQACYQVESGIHFGLGYDYYHHFTSPIRRYPDLITHRGIAALIEKGAQFDVNAKQPKRSASTPELKALGKHCSLNERRADDATRAAVAWLKCFFMQDKIGQTFEATVSGVAHFGLFVTLVPFPVEGMIPVQDLGSDDFEIDGNSQLLRGRRTAAQFAFGDTLQVRLVKVDLDEQQIEFVLK